MKELPTNNYIITEADRNQCLGSNELLNCPFCGSKPISCGILNEETGNTVYKVICTGKDCNANTFCCHKKPEEARKFAIERWNKRLKS